MANAVFMFKQPVLDENNSIKNYIFYYESDEQTHQNNHTKELIDTLYQSGLNNLTEGKRAFIKINREMLLNPSIFSFPNELLIFSIDDAEAIDETILRRVIELKNLNMTFAILHTSNRENIVAEIIPLLPFLNYFIVDASIIDLKKFKLIMEKLRQYPLTMIAANLSDDNKRETFRSMGFKLFSGSYYLSSRIDDETEVNKGYQETLKLLNILEQSDSIDEIAAEFATFPNITLQLLRYLNSPAFTLKRTIKSIRHALLLIGRKDLRRWLLLLAFSQTSDGDSDNNPLLYSAKIRMALMQFLVDNLKHISKELSDEASFVAVLSLLQPLLGISYEKLFKMLTLDKTVKSALTVYEGTLGKLLELCIAAEQLNQDRIAELLEELNIDPETFKKALLNGYSQQ